MRSLRVWVEQDGSWKVVDGPVHHSVSDGALMTVLDNYKARELGREAGWLRRAYDELKNNTIVGWSLEDGIITQDLRTGKKYGRHGEIS